MSHNSQLCISSLPPTVADNSIYVHIKFLNISVTHCSTPFIFQNEDLKEKAIKRSRDSPPGSGLYYHKSDVPIKTECKTSPGNLSGQPPGWCKLPPDFAWSGFRIFEHVRFPCHVASTPFYKYADSVRLPYSIQLMHDSRCLHLATFREGNSYTSQSSRRSLSLSLTSSEHRAALTHN